MALDKAVLKALMISKVKAEPHYSLASGSDETWLDEFCDAISDAVVTHIKAAAVVNTVDNGTVTTGAGSGGTVVATGIGTVT